jgi:hypothetical protein
LQNSRSSPVASSNSQKSLSSGRPRGT